MNYLDPTPANQDDVIGDVVAILAATYRDDLAGVASIVGGLSPERGAAMAAAALGMLAELGPVAAGSRERWWQMLSEWRPGRQFGDLGDDPGAGW